MDTKKEKTKLNDELLDKVAGGTGSWGDPVILSSKSTEYTDYIKVGLCPYCRSAVNFLGCANYECTNPNCRSYFYVVASDED